MNQFEMFELHFSGIDKPKSDFVSVDLKATFTVGSYSKTVSGFYDGNGIYKIRFYPEFSGEYTYEIFGIINKRGSIFCYPCMEKNKGIVRAKGTHLCFDGGDYFYPFGTTVYALIHQSENLIDASLDTLKKSSFNKVRLCVFPKRYVYNSENPRLYPFERSKDGKFDVNKPCGEFWDNLEKQIVSLERLGIQTDLILFHPYDDEENWGFADFSTNDCLIYLDYLLRRLSAFESVWFSIANEYDLILNKQIEDWQEIENFIFDNDPFHHLLSIHQCIVDYDYARKNITHISTQSKYLTNIPEMFEKYNKPIIFDEVGYEGNLPQPWGNLSAKELVHRFFQCVVQGAYCTHGETFDSSDNILWWSKGGKLKGESEKRISYLKDIVYSLPEPIECMTDPSDVHPSAFEQMYGHLLNQATKEKITADKIFDRDCFGHIGQDVFLAYFGHHCRCKYSWNLPVDCIYKIDLIDAWNMTTETIIENAAGLTDVPLPSREMIALIARRMN